MNNSRKFPKSNKNMIIINPYIGITLSFLWHTLTVVDKDRQENYKSALVRKTIILYIEYILFVYSLFYVGISSLRRVNRFDLYTNQLAILVIFFINPSWIPLLLKPENNNFNPEKNFTSLYCNDWIS